MLTKFYQFTENDLNNKSFEEGALYCTNDTNRIYIDPVGGGGVRTLISADPIILSTEIDRENLLSPISNKIYFVLSSSNIYIYQNDIWHSYASIDNTLTISGKAADAKIVGDRINALSSNNISILNAYPIGSIYMSINSTSPAYLFGGTWEQIKDRFLFATGTYAAGATGGESTHTLTINEMPSHNHSYGTPGAVLATGGSINRPVNRTTYSTSDTYQSTPRGGSAAHNNMPPFLVVYIWRRVS